MKRWKLCAVSAIALIAATGPTAVGQQPAGAVGHGDRPGRGRGVESASSGRAGHAAGDDDACGHERRGPVCPAQRAGAQSNGARSDGGIRAEGAGGHGHGGRNGGLELRDEGHSVHRGARRRHGTRHRAGREEPRLRDDVDQRVDPREDSRADDDAGARRPIGRRRDDERERTAGRRRARRHPRRNVVQRHRAAALRGRRRSHLGQLRQSQRPARDRNVGKPANGHRPGEHGRGDRSERRGGYGALRLPRGERCHHHQDQVGETRPAAAVQLQYGAALRYGRSSADTSPIGRRATAGTIATARTSIRVAGASQGRRARRILSRRRTGVRTRTAFRRSCSIRSAPFGSAIRAPTSM